MRCTFVSPGLQSGELISFKKLLQNKLRRDDIVITGVCMRSYSGLECECDGKCAFNDNAGWIDPGFEVFYYFKEDNEGKFIDEIPAELREKYYKMCALDIISDKWYYDYWYINGKRVYFDDVADWLVDSEKELSNVIA